MKKRIAIIAAVTALVVGLFLFTLPDYKSFTYVGRTILWGESDFYDHEKFAYKEIKNGSNTFTFDYEIKEDDINTLLEDIHYTYKQKTYAIDDVDQFFTETDTTSFIVIKDDKVIYERYFNNYDRESINTSFSMAKSFLSFLIGKAVEEGYIESIDAPITKYIPELDGRGFEEISVKHLLMMSSGIRYREGQLLLGDDAKTYYSPNLRRLAIEETQIVEPPGGRFLYNNYHPLLLGLILERATKQSVADYLHETLWKPIGMEYSASWSIDSQKHGFEKMESGINATSIDYAKFGRLFLHNGNWEGEQIISSQWVTESTTAMAEPRDDYYDNYSDWDFFKRNQGYYKYMWWGYQRDEDDYDFFANGKYGQIIYVSPKHNVVIVRNGVTTGKVDWWPDILFELVSKL
jgi:Beta-lactamase class C and other penicillin binding proteins